jgi:type II secretory pathway component PulF
VLTQAIVATSHWLMKYGWILAIAVVGGIFWLRRAL